MSGFDNEVLNAENVDFRGVSPVEAQVTADGQLLIGSTSSPNIVVGSLASTDASVTITVGSGTIDLSAGGAVPTQFDADSGSASPAANILTLSGGTGVTTSASGSTVTFTLDTPVSVADGGTGASTLTDGGILLGSGTSAITATSQPTDGQLLIGSTGVDPVLGSLASADSSITITGGSGTIDLVVDPSSIPTIPTTFDADSGSATVAMNTITITGGTGVTTSASGAEVTITLDTPVSVGDGGTGASTLTDGGIVLGSGTSAVTVTSQPTDGQLLIGSTGVDPVLGSLASSDSSITITGGSGTIDLVVDTSGTPTIPTTFTTDSGNAVPALNVINILGGTGISTSGATDTVTVTLDTPVAVGDGGTGASTLTDGGILLGSGTSAITATSQPTDGQLLIGSTGVDPVLGSLASSDSSLTITGGSGTIDLVVDTSGTPTIPTTFTTDSGDATPALNVLNVLGGTGISTSGATDTVTITLDTPVAVADGGTGATTLTDGGILLGSGTSAITATAQPTDGQLLIGSTGVDPVLGSITSTGSTITVSEGAGTINLESGSAVVISVPTDSGTATPSSGVLTIAGAGTVSTSGSGSTVTITGSGGGGSFVLLSTATISDDSTVNFEGFISASYTTYMWVLSNVIPTDDSDELQVRVGTGAGPTYDSNAVYDCDGANLYLTGLRNQFTISGTDVGSATSENGISGVFYLTDPSATIYRAMYWLGSQCDTSGGSLNVSGNCIYKTTTAVTALQFFYANSNVESGVIHLYGIANS